MIYTPGNPNTQLAYHTLLGLPEISSKIRLNAKKTDSLNCHPFRRF
ncbi:hypothetical protein AVDCRST_MAG81-1788 [uncultured Synechococcales cyanobacterium]|uniref:Uncharacterized protein n=1 Tax=uncultured Synechococcales cyanobacterium TaxID=1936017 RepID=A0A6J4V898_9CYAN|nr:hypothetical protein AVDCRST_MAG81-1788 [uncultured Synechococcales cyanobacterium]